MPCFDVFSEDVIKTLNLKLERLDKIKILSDMIGYHVGNYIYTVGNQYSNSECDANDKLPTYIAEVLTKNTNSIRKSSIQSISVQRNKVKRALLNKIPKIYNWYDEAEEKKEREDILKTSKDEAIDYLNQNVVGYPHVCFRHIGFVSKKIREVLGMLFLKIFYILW
ncbi:hypothetical protein [Vibrio parahaemolyticus]|uniref:hypothetical protein n=1 Tax=Vibrio parahaemolyticus TaxID=670 RepID=UPI002ACDFEC4|nr:hypothetical protein [Vibrio parahaemolyticus]